MLMPDHEVEPPRVPMTPVLSSLIDQLIENEQRQTGERADVIRRRYNGELYGLVRTWIEQKQRAHLEGPGR